MATAKELAILISGSDKATPALKQLQADLKGVAGQAQQSGEAGQKASVGLGSMAATASGLRTLDGSLKGVASQTQQAGLAADKASGGFGNLLSQGAKMGAGFIGITSAVAVVGKLTSSVGDAIQNASSLNETMNKSEVVFGSSAAAVAAFGDRAALSMGQSKQQAVAAAAGFGNLFKTMGTGQEEAAKMSMNVVQLASDLASFHNIKPEEALEKLRSGLVGETEPMRQLGVLIDENAVKTKAMELGLKGVNGELTQSEKVQARYALILEQSKDAAGDFARTSDDLANSQRRLDAQTANLSANFGSLALGPMTAVTGGLVKMTQAVMEAADAYGFLGNLVGAKLGEIGDAISGVNKELADQATAINAVENATFGSVEAAWKLYEATGAQIRASEEQAAAAAKARDDVDAGFAAWEKSQADMAARADAIKEAEQEAAKAAREATQATERAISQAKQLAEQQQKAFESAARGARDLARAMEQDLGAAQLRIADIAQTAGDAWIDKWFDVDDAIRQAQQSSEKALRSMDDEKILSESISNRRKALDERLRGEDRIFDQQMDDERYHHQEAVSLKRIAEQEARDLARARSDDEKRQIREKAAADREQLRLAHMAYDEEVKWRIQQEDKATAFKKTLDQQRADLERQLNEDAMNRRRADIEAEKEARISAINADWDQWQKVQEDKTKKAILEATNAAKAKLQAEAENYWNKLADVAAPGLEALAGLIQDKLGSSLAQLTGLAGGAGLEAVAPALEEGAPNPFAGVAPEHQPGGAIFDAWWSSLDESGKSAFKAERPDWGLAGGGIVTRPIVARLGENAPRVPEAVIPLDRAGGFGGDIDYERLAQALGRRPIVLQVDGRTLATVLTVEQDYSRSIG